MNTSTCILEPTPVHKLTQDDAIFFEISTGTPVTEEECRLRVDYCYFLTKCDESGRTKCRATRTINELVDIYIDKSRHIVGTELHPYPVRNIHEEDADSCCQPLSDGDMREFKTRLFGKDSQRYHLSFSS